MLQYFSQTRLILPGGCLCVFMADHQLAVVVVSETFDVSDVSDVWRQEGCAEGFLSRSLMSFPPSLRRKVFGFGGQPVFSIQQQRLGSSYLHQPIIERVKAMVVRMAETKKQDPTQQVSSIPGTERIRSNAAVEKLEPTSTFGFPEGGVRLSHHDRDQGLH